MNRGNPSNQENSSLDLDHIFLEKTGADEDLLKALKLLAKYNLLHVAKDYFVQNKDIYDAFVMIFLEPSPSGEYRLKTNINQTTISDMIKRIYRRVNGKYKSRITNDLMTIEKIKDLINEITQVDGSFDQQRFINAIVDYYNDEENEFKKSLTRVISEHGLLIYQSYSDEQKGRIL